MSAAHTPGPWAVSKQKARRVTASGVIICNAVLRNRGGPKHKTELKDEHEAEANAHVIAAAPELYEVAVDSIEILEVAIDNWNMIHPSEPDEVLTDLRRRFIEALAKARGES